MHCITRVSAFCILDLVLLFVLYRVQLESWMWLQCCHKTQLCWGLFPLTCQVLCSLESDCWYQSGVCLERDKRPSYKVCMFRVMKNRSTFAFLFWNDAARRKAVQKPRLCSVVSVSTCWKHMFIKWFDFWNNEVIAPCYPASGCSSGVLLYLQYTTMYYVGDISEVKTWIYAFVSQVGLIAQAQAVCSALNNLYWNVLSPGSDFVCGQGGGEMS